LLTAVIWWVSPSALAEAASQVDWRWLLPATAAMVVALYFWDALCLPVAYGIDRREITYRQSLHLRGLSYFGGALNYGLGQAALAWGMARLQHASLVRMLSRSVLLAYHDFMVLLAMGLVASLLTANPDAARLRPFTAIGLVGGLALAALVQILPQRIRARVRWADTQSLLEGWSLARSLRLLALRFVFFSILIVYAVVALSICRLKIDQKVIVSTVPLVLLADGLPNFAGLGTRETSLLLLLDPHTEGERATLLAMSLIWSAGMIIGRFLIAMAHLGFHYFRPRQSSDKSG
jgi:hypothetical protein